MLLIPIQTCLYLFHISFSEIPVEIIRPPQDILEAPGADVVFLAELNKDKVEVQWLKNNMIIVQGDKHQMIVNCVVFCLFTSKSCSFSVLFL